MSTRISARTIGLLLADGVIIYFAIVVAMHLRLDWDGAAYQLLENNALLKIALATGICVVTIYFYDLYDYAVMNNRREMILRLIQVMGIAWTLLALLFYFVPPLMIGRGTLVYSLFLSLILLLGWRGLIHFLTGHPDLGEKVLILGAGPIATDTARVVTERRDAGYRVVGFVTHKGYHLNGNGAGHSKNGHHGPQVLGTTDQLATIVHDKRVDRIVVALGQRRGNFPTDVLLRMSLENNVNIEECASFYERITGQVHLDMLRPSWLIFSGRTRDTQIKVIFRDIINRTLALLGLIASLPIALLTAIAIRLESRGDVLYRQERVGKNGSTFQLLKFRSMRVDAEADGKPVWATTDDDRVTAVGRVIRKIRVDEIPQFWNILKGEMSFIGPRPERPHFVSELAEKIPFYEHRHLVAPGLTGWAQIKYPYGASVEDARQKLQYDLYYIKNQSLALDMIIIFETIKTVIFGRGGR